MDFSWVYMFIVLCKMGSSFVGNNVLSWFWSTLMSAVDYYVWCEGIECVNQLDA